MRLPLASAALLILALGTATPVPSASETADRSPLTVEFDPIEAPSAPAGELLESEEARRVLAGARHRVLAFESGDDAGRSGGTSCATVYDYTNARTLRIERDPLGGVPVRISTSDEQPLPTYDEWLAAVGILERNQTFGLQLREGRLAPYRPMPPVLGTRGPLGRLERVVTVGLAPQASDALHQIVGVNMVTERIHTYENNAPEASVADGDFCGAKPATQPTTPKGTAGRVSVTIRRAGTELWRFLAARPAQSSGVVGSGIEIRHVEYLGRRVLERGHAPILNVRYDQDACGPFRDWLYEESMISAAGADVAPGFRWSRAPVRTIVDSRSDEGSFLGVGVYVEGEEVVLVSELEASWYRYISEWRFHSNGTIRPRFAFDAVDNSCVCDRHRHHVYWRLDFDVGGSGSNRVEEFNSSAPSGGVAGWSVVQHEIRRERDPGRSRQWRVSNAGTGHRYALIPGANDGVADAEFGIGDVWVLKHHPDEIDDGQGYTTDFLKARAGIDHFVDGEGVNGQNVVVWYAGHLVHDESEGEGESLQTLGPDLVPVAW